MAARDNTATPAHGQMASQLREQLQGLVPDQVGTAITSTADEAGAKVRQLLDYAMLALEFREPLGQIWRRMAGRSETDSPQPDVHTGSDSRDGNGIGAFERVRRHPVLTVGIAISAGLIAYALVQAGRPALQRRLGRA